MFCWTNSSSGGDGGSEPLDSVGNMSKSDLLRELITDKLSTAAREILAVVERTVADYEEEAVGFKREIDWQRRQLELLQPQVKLERRDLDIHELLVMTEDKEEEEEQQHTHLPELTPDLHGHEVVMEARQEEEQQPDVEDTGTPGLLLYSEHRFEEEGVEMPSAQLETSSTQMKPDRQRPARLFSPKVQSDGWKPRSTSDTHLDFRIRILEDCPGNVLSNTVFQNSPVQHLKCPRDLQEADFLDLLRSTFPRLANEEHIHFFRSGKNRLLQRLEVKSLTPEEIHQAIRSAGNSALYIRLKFEGKKPSKPLISDTQTTLDFRICILEDSQTTMLSNPVFKKYPLHHLRCPCGLQENNFLELLRSTFPQLATDEPFDFFISSRNRNLQPLKVDARTPEEIYKAIKSCGDSALYIRPKKKDGGSSSSATSADETKDSTRRKSSKPLKSDAQIPLDLRICFLEDSAIDVLSNIVFVKYPLRHLRCPRGLKEDDFLELLRSTFPQLATNEPFDFFMSSTNKKLRPLKVDARTPEEINKAIKSCGHSALYIKPKKKDDGSSSATTSANQTEDSTRRKSSNPLISDSETPLDFRICILGDSAIEVLSNIVFKKYPMQDLRCPRGLKENDFLELLRSTFPQLATDEPFDFFISSRNRRLRPLKVDPRTPEKIYKAIDSRGHSALYVRPKALEEEKDLHCLPANVDPPPSDAEAKRSENAALHSSSPTQHVDGSTVTVLPSCSTSENQQTEDDAADSEMDTSDDINGDGDWEPDPTPQLRKTKKKQVVKRCVKKHDAASEMDTCDDINGHKVSDGDGDWEADHTPQLPKTKKKQVVKHVVKKLKCKAPCKVCGIEYTLLGSLIKHSLSHLDEPQNVCGVCGTTFDSVEELKEHIQNYQKTYDCLVCGKSFYSKDGLRRHAPAHTGDRPYKCNICSKSFHRISILNNHFWVHVEEKPYRCDICPKSFAFKAQLAAHTKTHTSKEQYHCNICGKSISDRSSFNRHKLTHTQQRQYCCPVCGKCFKHRSYLKFHEQIHMVREQAYLCDICCKTFMASSTLKAHMRTHSTERPFICATCNKGFVAKADLKKHMRVHTGEAPYGCNVCGRFFKQRAALNSHVRGHSGIKQYTCKICGKASARKSHLKVHMRTHNGERPYKCTLCEKAFTQSHSLKSHMKSHEPEEENPVQSQRV